MGFDYFHLDTERGRHRGADHGAHLSPAAPDGGGWYTTAPSFSLAADDGEGSGVATEYRIGDGAWTPYTASRWP